MKQRPHFSLLFASALTSAAFAALRHSRGVPVFASPASGDPIHTTTGALLILLAVSWCILALGKFGEDEDGELKWPYALAIAFCLYPILITIV
jgi:hypothetical protein